MPQSHAQVWLHIVFSTKERRGFLQKESFRDQMFGMLAHHVKECGCVSASVEGHVDHVHLLVALSRTITIADLVEHVKTETSKWAKIAGEGNALFQWQSGYGAFSVSHSMKDNVDEYRRLCEKHGIEIDERYVWD